MVAWNSLSIFEGKRKSMGFIRADIEIANAFDMGLARRGQLDKEAIRKQEVNILVDTGAYSLCINENLATQLGLMMTGKQTFELADGEIKTFPVSEPVELRFKNRTTACRAVVLPGNTGMILGCIPLEDMDVVLDPLKESMDLPKDRPYVAMKILK